MRKWKIACVLTNYFESILHNFIIHFVYQNIVNINNDIQNTYY